MELEGMFNWAMHYASMGLSVIPLREGKMPAVRWTDFQSRLPSKKELGAWFIGQKLWGMALVCGRVSNNLVRIDFDDPADYDKLIGQFPKTLAFKSQRAGGGYGLLYFSTSDVPILPQKTFRDFPKLEVRGEGAITVVPPTPGYLYLDDNQIVTVDIKALLTRLFDYDPERTRRMTESLRASSTSSDELSQLLKETASGERSNNLVRIASMLRARGIDSESAAMLMEANFNEHWDHDGMDWDEARSIFQAAYNRYAHEGVKITGSQPLKATIPASTDEPRLLNMSFSDIGKMKKPGRVLIDRLVLSGTEGNTILAAPTKMGKTSLLLDACISASRGEPVWGTLTVERPLTVAFIDQELKYQQILENKDLMAQVLGEPDEARLRILANPDGQFQIGDQKGLDMLYRELEKIRPDLVVLDGWGWFVGHQASDPKMVTPAMTWWKQVRQSLGCATIIIHHYKKQQSSGRYDQGAATDELDQIEGLKRFSDQAQTVLGYTPIDHYDTYAILAGRTNHTAWDPLRLVVDYDYTTLTHRIVAKEEGSELFDPETFRKLWEVSADSRWLKGAMNTICNRLGISQHDLAIQLGVSQPTLSRWRSGQRAPSAEVGLAIKELYEKARHTPMKARLMPRGGGHKDGTI